jgi:hypothetical protein
VRAGAIKVYFSYAGRILSPLVAPLPWLAVQFHDAQFSAESGAGGFVLFWVFAAFICYLTLAIVGLPVYWLLLRSRVPPSAHFTLFCSVGAIAGGAFHLAP